MTVDDMLKGLRLVGEIQCVENFRVARNVLGGGHARISQQI